MGAPGRTGGNQMTLCPQFQHAAMINHRPSEEAKNKTEIFLKLRVILDPIFGPWS